MRWYDDLYLTEYMQDHKGKRRRAIRRIKRKSLLFNKSYVLTLRKSKVTGTYFFEIICGSELAKRYYPTKDLFVIGLAEDYDSACLLSCNIVLEAYEATGEFDVAAFIAGRMKEDRTSKKRKKERQKEQKEQEIQGEQKRQEDQERQEEQEGRI